MTFALMVLAASRAMASGFCFRRNIRRSPLAMMRLALRGSEGCRLAGCFDEVADALRMSHQARPAFRVGDVGNQLPRVCVRQAEQGDCLLHFLLGPDLYLADSCSAGCEAGEGGHRIALGMMSATGRI